jgi:hypothetical protein
LDDAKQRLHDIVEGLRRDGGRVDIVLDGQPVVSLVRTSELERTDVNVVEEPPPKKRAPRRSGPKPRLQRAYKREPRVTED